MTAPFFFPENASGSGWGGPVHDLRENSCVLPRIAYNSAAGVQQTGREACLRCAWGFLTWAAKPSVRKSLTPQKTFPKAASYTLLPVACLHYYGISSPEVPRCWFDIFRH